MFKGTYKHYSFKSIMLFVGFWAAVLAPAVALGSEEKALRNFKVGDAVPSFTLQPLGGGAPINFNPASGKPAAVFFFSVEPEFRKTRSLALLSVLDEVALAVRGRAEVIGLYVENTDIEVVQEYIQKSSVKLPVLIDRDRDVYDLYGVFMMPLVVMVSSKGTLHTVIPYTFDIKNLIEGNFKILFGEWTPEKLAAELAPKEEKEKSAEEKEYIRRVNYGRVMVSRSMFSHAMREFQTAIKLLPSVTDAHVELGFVQIYQKEWAAAESTFREALKHDPEADAAIAGLGLALHGRGDDAAALPVLENAFISPEPKLEVIIGLGEIYEQKGEINKAFRMHKLAVSRLMELYNRRTR